MFLPCRALEDVRDSGVRSWSLDLMSALPGLGEAAWARTLSQAIAWGPDHVSVYDLQVEEGTPFARMYQARAGDGWGASRGWVDGSWWSSVTRLC